MCAAPIKLVAVDEDGTFLYEDHSFNRARFEPIWQRMQELGIRFVVATGNHHLQVRRVLGERVDSMGLVGFNGTCVMDAGELVYSGNFDRETGVKIVRALREVGASIVVDTVDCGHFQRGEAEPFIADMEKYFGAIDFVDDQLAFAEAHDICMVSTFIDPARGPELMAHVREAVGDAACPVDSGDGYYDVLLPGVSKGTGVALLAERWGIAPEECITFGNAPNDLPMIEWAGTGVLMANAPDEIKPLADRIAPRFDEDGVLAVLEEVLF